MSNYRRVWVPGGTCFFTVNLLERRRRLLVEHIDLLRDAFRAAKAARPFHLLAIVVLPDHLHCVWRLPDGDADNANRWAQIESGFSRALPIHERRSSRRITRRECVVWALAHLLLTQTSSRQPKRASHAPPRVFLLTLTVSLLSLRLSRDRKRSNVPPKSVFLLSVRSNVPPQRVVLLTLTVSRHRKTSNVSPKRCMRQRKRVVLLTHRLAHRPKGPGMATGGACASVLPRSAGFATQPTGPRRSDRRHAPPAP